jgi:putative ABC transport system permease protein
MGIGISTAVFSVVYAVLLAPLPYADPQRIVSLHPVTAGPDGQRFNANPALYKHWRGHLSALEHVSLTKLSANFNLTGDGTPERLQGARTTFNWTRVLGVQPLLGRAFTEAEELADSKVVMLSHGLWMRRFGGDASILGRKLQLNGTGHEVIAVMPPEFVWPDATFELWAPLQLPPDQVAHGANYGFLCVGRLKNGQRLEQAQVEVERAMVNLAREHPNAYMAGDQRMGAKILRLSESQTAKIRPTLLMLTAAVACLLAIGCLNLAVLQMVKANGRAREILMRVSLGASGSRLRRQLMAEAVPLIVLGAAGGLIFAHWMLLWLTPMLPAGFPSLQSTGLNAAAAGLSLLSSAVVVLLASLLPMRQSWVQQLASSLQQNSRAVAGGSRVRDVLVVGQVALALLLLFGAVLFGRSFAALMTVKPGFAQERVLTMHLAASREKFPEDRQIAEYYRRLTERVKAIPGVIEAGFVNRLPLSGTSQTGGVEFEGKSQSSSAAGMFMVDWRSATPGYFGAMGIPLLRGRLFNEHDAPDSRRVGLIDAEMAKRIFGNEDPIGKRFRQSLGPNFPNDTPWSEIVGVVGHVLNDSLEQDVRPQVYWPETQRAQERAALVVRTTDNPTAYAEAVVAEIRRENPDQPVFEVRSMESWIARSLQTRTLATSLVSIFGFASVLLACLGLYGVISFSTGLRSREFGLRLALGATAGQVRRLVLLHAGRIAGVGLVIGLGLCWPAAYAIRGMLFGVGVLDLTAWVSAPALLIAVALLAALSPAVRAARVDPARTLQAD